MKNKKILWITTTAVFTALLITFQYITSFIPAPAGQFVTGSLVNLILIISVILIGLPSGLTVAAISPILAKLIGIGPVWEIIPFVILGNITIVLVWYFIGNMNFTNKHVVRIVAVITGALLKPGVLYLGIVKIAIPFLLNLPEKQATVVSSMFSYPQIVTALIGGTVAVMILPVLIPVVEKIKAEN